MVKKVLISFVLINIVTLFLFKIWINYSWSVDGHDTFQYIHWSTTLFTEDRSTVFFRPFLYLILYIAHTISDWSPYTFQIFLYACSALTIIIILNILKDLKADLFSRLLSIIIFLSTLVFLEGDTIGWISSFEGLLLSLAVLFAIKVHKNPNNKIYLGIFIITGLLASFTHEEKFVFFTALLILTLLEHPKKMLYCLSLYVMSALLVILWLKGFDLSSITKGWAGAGVGESWGVRSNIFENYFSTLKSSLYGFDPIFRNIFIGCSIFVFVRLLQLLNDLFSAYKLNSSWKLFIRSGFLLTLSKNSFIQNGSMRFLIIPSFLYILTIGILFNGIDLPRVTGPVTFFFVIGFFNIFYKKFVINQFFYMIIFYVVITIFSINSILYFDPFLKLSRTDKINSKFAFAENFIPKKSCVNKSPYILITNAFDKRERSPGWGISEIYGLASKVYYGDCVITEKRLNEDFKVAEQKEILTSQIDFIVTDETKHELIENSYVSNLNLTLWKKNVYQDCWSQSEYPCSMTIYQKDSK